MFEATARNNELRNTQCNICSNHAMADKQMYLCDADTKFWCPHHIGTYFWIKRGLYMFS